MEALYGLVIALAALGGFLAGRMKKRENENIYKETAEAEYRTPNGLMEARKRK